MTTPQHAILWDMDGTLLDTTEMHMRAWMMTLEHQGLHITKEDFMRQFGKNNQSNVLHYLPDATSALIQAISDEKEQIFCDLVPGNTKVYPGVISWLDYFTQKGYMQCIASSAPMHNIEVLLDEIKIGRYFNYIQPGSEVPGKPDPTIFNLAAQHVGIPASRCLVIEDAPPGVQAARQAGIRCVAITNTRNTDELSDADLVIHAFDTPGLHQAEKLLLMTEK